MQNEKEKFKENFIKRLVKFSTTNQLYQEADELSKIIGSSVLTLKGKK